MLPTDAKIISVDDHVIEHRRVWLDRLPAKYADVAPRIVKLPDGNDTWLYEGAKSGNFALNAVAGKHPREFGMDPRSYDDMLPGCHDIADRIKDMDIEGVWAQLCFPNFGGFAGSTFFAARDKDHVEASVREIERTAAKGARSISFIEAPHKLGLPSYHTDHWDPILRACEERQLPLSMHFGSGGMPLGLAPDGDFFISIALFGVNSMNATVDLLFSGMFDKFPNLKVALSEGGIGWMPYI